MIRLAVRCCQEQADLVLAELTVRALPLLMSDLEATAAMARAALHLAGVGG